MGWLKNMVKRWLNVIPANDEKTFNISETLTHNNNVLLNRIWYRSDPNELSQFYSMMTDSVNRARFWAIVPPKSLVIRKIHSGLPALIVNKLVNIVVNDSTGIELDETNQNLWNEIDKDNDFKKVIKTAVKDMLVDGDGAFKFSFDPELSNYPIIEFYSGDRVDYVYNRGRLIEYLFYTQYIHDKKEYTLTETYGKGYINYNLYDKDGKEIALETIPQTQGLVDVTFGDYFMAVKLMLEENPKYKNRGKSIFEGKHDSFDSFDEIISNWLDAVRLGRTTKYIPEDLIPKDPITGEQLPLNPFTNSYTVTGSPMTEDSNQKAYTVQPQIFAQELLTSYVTFLDSCLTGLISPSTLGIDVKKLDNAEAQREKEKTTLYSRDSIITVLEEVIPQVVNIALKVFNGLNNGTLEDVEVSITFGEYANPSFEAMVETLGKAYQFGIISTDRVVKELYGANWSEEEIQEEINLIKKEKQSRVPQFGMNDDLDEFNFGDE